MHDALYGYTAVAIGNNIVVLGECEDHGYLRSFEAFNVDRYSWEVKCVKQDGFTLLLLCEAQFEI